jgi:hypothetical protein
VQTDLSCPLTVVALLSIELIHSLVRLVVCFTKIPSSPPGRRTDRLIRISSRRLHIFTRPALPSHSHKRLLAPLDLTSERVSERYAALPDLFARPLATSA